MSLVSLRARQLASASFAVAAFMGAASVAAQDAPATSTQNAEDGAEEGGGNTIVVTARRREERLVDVPIAVSTFSGDELIERGALDITDLNNAVPNVTLESSRATNSTLTAFIRGIGQQDPVSGFEQGVGIYLDDVYLNRPQAAVLDIYNIERIEVLRGPQGTLYGRNTIGGAVKYVTKLLPQDPAFDARVTYGSFDQADAVINGSVPLGDMVRAGASFARLSRGGFGDNLTLGTENYNKDIWAGRGSLELGGYGEPVFVRIQGDYTRDESLQRGGHRLIPGLASGAPVLDNVFDTRGAINDPEQDIEAYGLSMKAEVELSDTLSFRSISAWRRDTSDGPIDFDALPTVDLDVPGRYINEQLSQELQFIYESDRLSGLVGFFYLDAKADTIFDSRLFTTLPTVLPLLTGSTNAAVDTETYAVFGDVTYDLTDQLSISLGGRYTWDERTADILRQNFILGGSANFDNPGVLIGTDTDFQGSEDFNKFTPRASISFMPTPDHNIYASFSQGFKGGGFDPRGAGGNANDLDGDGAISDAEVAEFLSFEPEEVDSYEIGYKGSLLDGDVNIAIAAFYSDYTNVQIPGSVACTVSGAPTFCGVVSNAGKAEIKGIEFEGAARLGAGFNLALSAGWIDAEYNEFITNIGNTPTDVADSREVQNTPEFTGNANLTYSTALGEGDLLLGANVSYRSSTTQFEIPSPFLDQGGYALVDASVIYTAPSGRWSLGVFGKNLFDKEYITSGYQFTAQDPVTGDIFFNGGNGLPLPSLGTEGIITAFHGNPRQVFATFSIDFD